MPKQLIDWQPQPGDEAVVPGGPANARYIDTLDAQECEAIRKGRRGYYPLTFSVVTNGDALLKTMSRYADGDTLERIYFDRRSNLWRSTSAAGGLKTINHVMRYLNQEWGKGNYRLIATQTP